MSSVSPESSDCAAQGQRGVREWASNGPAGRQAGRPAGSVAWGEGSTMPRGEHGGDRYAAT